MKASIILLTSGVSLYRYYQPFDKTKADPKEFMKDLNALPDDHNNVQDKEEIVLDSLSTDDGDHTNLSAPELA